MKFMQFNLQDSNSPIMENLIKFHDHAMMIILMIMILIMYMIIFMYFNKFINRLMYEGQMLEIIWTILPILFLFMLAIPSLKTLYMMEEHNEFTFNIKVIAHQWHWSYEYLDIQEVDFDSFMINNINKIYNFRLLDVDNRMVIPLNLNMRLLISSIDVIHSFTVPSLGIKVDAIPGRLNQINFFSNRPGLYYGQCSEICGVNHSFMPIVLEINELSKFLYWILEPYPDYMIDMNLVESIVEINLEEEIEDIINNNNELMDDYLEIEFEMEIDFNNNIENLENSLDFNNNNIY